MDKIYIFGHRKPDTDSVTSAIALEYLKKSLGIYAEARVLSEINDETKFVLDKFNVKCPKYLNDVKLQIKDIEYHKNMFQSEYASIEEVYNYMDKNNITGVPIVDTSNRFKDIITAKIMLKEAFRSDSENIYTSYDNILKTLKGSAVLRFDSEIKGNVTAVTFKSTTFIEKFPLSENDILIVGDRHSIIEDAVSSKIKLLIITGDNDIKEEHIKIAIKNHVNIIKTPFNTYKTVKKISLCNYIKTLFTGNRPYVVSENEYYDDFLEKTKELGFNNYPVVDKNNVCKGLIRITDISKKNRKKVILVDHNESLQSADGLEEANILEVIDHHKIGDISTNNPINFRNMAVGSTNTIIYHLFMENRVDIPKVIASLMLAGIISDTLSLTSPTTTDEDVKVVESLEKISGLSHNEFALEIFNSSVNLDKKTEYDLITADIKTFQNAGRLFKVSQVTTMNATKMLLRKNKIVDELNKFKDITGSDYVIFMITDIMSNGSYLLYNDSQLTFNILERAFDQNIFEGVFLPGVVSRKKQIIPALMESE